MPSPFRPFDCRATSLTISAFAVLVISVIGVSNPRLAIRLMAEGGLVESLQVLLMGAAGALAARQGRAALRAGRPIALEVAIVSTMVMICVSEVDLDRMIFGTKIVATHFFVHPKYPLALRALAVLVVVGLPVAVGAWLLARRRQLRDAALAALREPWGQTAVFGAALYVVTQPLEGPIDRLPWQQHHLIEETLELLGAIGIFCGVAARHGLGSRLRRALERRPSNFGEEPAAREPS